MSQVTVLMLADISWTGFGRGILALAAVWWAWACYAWLTNTSDHDGPGPRLLLILAMAAMLMAAAFFDTAERELLWIVAAVMDLLGPVLVGTTGWSVTPAYFVERHGLIIIIALGEAIVGVGAGAEADLPRPSVVTVVLLAVLIAAGLWWSYFGYLRGGAERRLRGTTDRERSRLARDSYSYLHLPLVAGVVFFALGVHEAVAAPGEPLRLLPAVALAGGVAMF